MSVEKGDSQEGEPKVDEEEQEVKEATKENATETGEKTEVLAGNGEKTEVPAKNGKTSIGSVKGEEQTAENVEVLDKDGSSKQEDPVTKEAKEDAEQDVKCTEEPSGNEQAEPMEEGAGGRFVKWSTWGGMGEAMGLQWHLISFSLGEPFLAHDGNVMVAFTDVLPYLLVSTDLQCLPV